MSTIYPSGIDNNVTLPQTIDLVTPVKAEVVNNLREAIIAIEAELGIDPSREFGTVRARLDYLQDQLLNCGSAITVSENNTPIVTSLTVLDFIGSNVTVTDAGGGHATVQITGTGQDVSAEQETLPVTINGQTSFTLSLNPADSSTVMMFVNTLKQEFGTDYTVSGTSITYSGVPLITTDVVEFWYLVSDTVVVVAEQETVPVTINGQTAFTLTLSPSDSSVVQMFVNGMKQDFGTDYTVSGTAVTYSGSLVLLTTDVVEFWYLLGAGASTPDLLQVLATGNVTGGLDIDFTGGSALVSSDGDVTVNDNLVINGDGTVNGDFTINGKLTVTGLIDPTGLVLTEQAIKPTAGTATTGLIWVRTDNKLVFTDQTNTDNVLGSGSAFTIDDGYIAFGSGGTIIGDVGFQIAPDPSGTSIFVGKTGANWADLNVISDYPALFLYGPGGLSDYRGEIAASATRMWIDTLTTGLDLRIQSDTGKVVEVEGWRFPHGMATATIPTTNAIGKLTNDGAGNLTWDNSGGTGGGETFAETLAIGNSTDGYDIIVNDGTQFRTNNATGSNSADKFEFLGGTGGPSGGQGGNFEVTAGNAISGIGGYINLVAGVGVGDVGGQVAIFTGASVGDNAGNLNISTGASVSGGHGGDVSMQLGSGATRGGAFEVLCGGSVTGNGGSVTLSSGSGDTAGGTANITGGAGNGSNAIGGDVSITGGASFNTQTSGGTFGGSINITGGLTDNMYGGNINIISGGSNNVNDLGGSGTVYIKTADSPYLAGNINLEAGDASGSASTLGLGGSIYAIAGNGYSTPGEINILAGSATGNNAVGGEVFIMSGQGDNFGSGGAITLRTHNSTGSGVSGNLLLVTTGGPTISGNIELKTEGAGTSSGDINIHTEGSGSVPGRVNLYTGTNGSFSGSITLSTGQSPPAIDGTGAIELTTVSGSVGGPIRIITGGGATGGNFSVTTGSGGSGGDINLTCGPGGTAGRLILNTSTGGGGFGVTYMGYDPNNPLSTDTSPLGSISYIKSGGVQQYFPGSSGFVVYGSNDGSTGNGNPVTIYSGNAASGGSGSGGIIQLLAGEGVSSGTGGDVQLYAGPHGSGSGGGVNIRTAGDVTSGRIQLYAGGNSNTLPSTSNGISLLVRDATGAGGGIELLAGNSTTSGFGGSITISPGDAVSTNGGGGLYMSSGGNGNANGTTFNMNGASSSNGGDFYVNAGNSNSGFGGGGSVTLQAGTCASGGTGGGSINLFAGDSGDASAFAGNVFIRAGDTPTSSGCDINLNAASGGNGGSLYMSSGGGVQAGSTEIYAGNSSGGQGGSVTVASGTGSTTDGIVTINAQDNYVDLNSRLFWKSTVTTNNATTTTLATIDGNTNDATFIVESMIVARSTTNGDSNAYKIVGVFENTAGTLAQIGTTSILVSEEQDATWDVTFDTSGTNIRIRVTGAAANNINWKSSHSLVYTQ